MIQHAHHLESTARVSLHNICGCVPVMAQLVRPNFEMCLDSFKANSILRALLTARDRALSLVAHALHFDSV